MQFDAKKYGPLIQRVVKHLREYKRLLLVNDPAMPQVKEDLAEMERILGWLRLLK
jgi:hypothetical protein